MSVTLINPQNKIPLERDGDFLVDAAGARFPIVKEIPRFASSNYTDNFGFQWKNFQKTQIDDENSKLSRDRFFGSTQWAPADMAGKDILEVGSGAGRFSSVILKETQAYLWSVDYSEAVEANLENNAQFAPQRLKLFQASIYEMPFPENSFDYVFCFGVLQHTPDFEASVKVLIEKAKPGGEIAVDFYAIKGWWTKLQARYLLRPFFKKMDHKRLLALIERNIDWVIKSYDVLTALKLGFLTRFLPTVELRAFPATLTPSQRREWAILDTFDMFSPEYDQPQRIQDVVQMFNRNGAKVTFAGIETFTGGYSVVVRGIKLAPEAACE